MYYTDFSQSQGEWNERDKERISFPSAKAIIYSAGTTLNRRNDPRDKQGVFFRTVFTFTPSLGVCLVVRLKPSILPANSPTTAGLKEIVILLIYYNGFVQLSNDKSSTICICKYYSDASQFIAHHCFVTFDMK